MPPPSNGQGDSPGICDRTLQVRNAIVAAIDGVNNCSAVTGTHLSGITELDISGEGLPDGDKISALKAGDFAGLSGLTDLDLRSNRLTESGLPDNVFSGLSSLTTLTMSHNSFTAVPTGAFSGLSSLIYLYLDFGNGDLTTIPANAFSGLSSLQFLNLNNNGRLTTVNSGAFSGLTALRDLNLTSAKLTAVPSEALSGLSSLRDLSLGGNRVIDVPANAFSGLSALEALYLTGNQIATLDSRAFSGLSKLDFLNLQNNQLTALPDGVFAGLTASPSGLLLDGNPADLEVIVSLARVGNDQFKVTVHTGAPFPMTVRVTFVNDGGSEASWVDAAIPKGALESAAFGTPSGMATVHVVTLPALPTVHFAHSGYVLVQGGICDRTPQVRDAIVTKIPGVNNCLFVTDEHLASITGRLDLSVTPVHDDSKVISSLKAGDFSGLSGVTWLDLSGNKLSSLPDGIFSDMTSLGELNLEWGFWTAIPTNAFTGLPSLTRLDLGYGSGPNTTIPANAFSGLPSLTTLNLNSHRRITTIEPNAFNGLSNLIALNLGGSNKLEAISSQMFNGLSSLQHLTVGGSESISTIPWDTFSGLSELRHLSLGYNRISTLDARTFNGLSNLGKLYLNNNRLTTLPDGVFTGLTKLAGLQLEGNPAVLEVRVSLVQVGDDAFKVTVHSGAPFHMNVPITVTNGSIDGGVGTVPIPQGAAESEIFRVSGDAPAPPTVELGELPALPGLPTWIIPHNGYVLVKPPDPPLTVSGGICDRTPQVRDAIVAAILGVNSCLAVTGEHLAGITRLDLSVTPIHDVSKAIIGSPQAGDFAGLTSLTYLNLEGNRLSSLPNDIFSDLSSLTELNLNWGFWTAIPTNALSDLSTLTRLDIAYGSGHLITITDNAFSGLSLLETLDLRVHQKLTSVSSGAFSGLTSLEYLGLSSAKLTAVPSEAISGLSSLQSLSLAGNQITDVPAGAFSGLSALEYLHLSHNQIATLDSGAFSVTPELVRLELQNNRLTALPDGVFAGLSRLYFLYLNDNAAVPEVKVSLVKVGSDASGEEYKVTVNTGAPFWMNVPVTVTNGNVEGGSSTFTLRKGEVESDIFRVVGTPGASEPPTVAIGQLPALPQDDLPNGESSHKGYVLVKSVKPGTPQVTRIRSAVQSAPALLVAWTAPAGVAVTGYEAQHRRQGETAWTAYANPLSASAVAITLPDLQPGAVYEAQVRALITGGSGDWSDTGEGQANRPPHRRVWFYANNNVSVGVWYRDWNPATRYFGDADGDTLSFFESSDNDALVTSWVGDNGYTFNTFAHNPGRSTITYGVRDEYGGEVTRTVVYSAYANGVRRVPESPKGFYVGHPVAGVKTRHNYQISPTR